MFHLEKKNQPPQTYTEISEVLIVVQSVTHQKGVRHLKTNVWNKQHQSVSYRNKVLLSAVDVQFSAWAKITSGDIINCVVKK